LTTTTRGKSRTAPINTTINIDYADAINALVNNSIGETTNLVRYLIFASSTNYDSDLVPGGVDFVFPAFSKDEQQEATKYIQSEEVLRRGSATLVSTLLAGIVTDGLARLSGNGAMVLESQAMFLLPDRTPNGTLQGLSPLSGYTAGTLHELNTTDAGDVEKHVRLDFKIHRYGYGYKWHENPTTQFGISVLLIHTTAALIYTLYLLGYFIRNWHGGLPKAWETIPELFVLAVNSRRSNRLKNTAAGIKESSTWGIAVSGAFIHLSSAFLMWAMANFICAGCSAGDGRAKLGGHCREG
jgi:hypothetical protein